MLCVLAAQAQAWCWPLKTCNSVRKAAGSEKLLHIIPEWFPWWEICTHHETNKCFWKCLTNRLFLGRCVAPVRPGWWQQPRHTGLGCAIESERTAFSNKVWDGSRAEFCSGEEVTCSEEALVSATEINPASEADLKALTPKAQTPSVLFWVLLQVLLPWLLTPGLGHTTLQPKHMCFVLQYPVTQGQPWETLCLREDWAASPFFLLVSVRNSKSCQIDQEYHPCRGYSQRCMQKTKSQAWPYFPAPYHPGNTLWRG